MNLKPFEVTVSEGCIRATVEIWTATAKAARESGESYARELGLTHKANVTVKSLDNSGRAGR